MKKILCPTDFSKTADNAIAYAAKLAQTTGSSLTLFNIQSLFELAPAVAAGGKSMKAEAAAQALEAQSRQVSKAFRISCDAETTPAGRALSTVIAEKGQHYDLIVMGSDGPDDLYQLLTGTHSYHAVRKSQTPVLLIPAGHLYSEIGKMIFAFDFTHGKTLPIASLVPFVLAVKCELTLLQVLEEPLNEQLEDKLQDARRSLTASLKDDITVKYEQVLSADIAEGIEQYIREDQPDVLALCAKGRNAFSRLLHKSTIRQVTAHMTCPVLIVH